MATVRVPPGVFRGESRAAVSGRWYAVSLVRWREGNLCPVGGWDKLNPQPFASVPRAGLTALDNNFKLHRLIVCDAHVYRGDRAQFFDITPAGYLPSDDRIVSRGYGSGAFGLADFGRDDDPRGGSVAENLAFVVPVAFSIDVWAEDILFGSSTDGKVWVWTPKAPLDAPKLIPNCPALIQGFITTDEHALMVFGSEGQPNRVAWSDLGNREGWNYANVTGQAGFFDLEGAGLILCARKIPGGVLVFTQTSVWLGTYIGAPYFYGFTKIAEHLTPISPQAVTVAAGKAFWMTAAGFAQYIGGVVQPLPCTLDLNPSEDIDTRAAPRRVCSGYNGKYPEIWWFYPTKGQGEKPENDRYVIYNHADGWWSEGELSRSFYAASPIETMPFAGSPDMNVFQHERGYLDQNIERGDRVFAEVGNVSFDDGENLCTVLSAQPDMRESVGKNSVQFRFSGNLVRGAPFKPLGAWSPFESGYMPARFTARDFSYRVVEVKAGPWSVGATVFEVKGRKRR